MFVMVAWATESFLAESAVATASGLGARGRGGAIYVVIWALATFAASIRAALMNSVRTIFTLRVLRLKQNGRL
jgi:hypothetical protein